jgi:hypothetical protein
MRRIKRRGKVGACALFTVIAFTAPLFSGISEGKNYGLIGIVAGIFFGLCIGIVACLAVRGAFMVMSRLLPEDGKRPLLTNIVGLLFYLAMFAWAGIGEFVAMCVMRAIFWTDFPHHR